MIKSAASTAPLFFSICDQVGRKGGLPAVQEIPAFLRGLPAALQLAAAKAQ